MARAAPRTSRQHGGERGRGGSNPLRRAITALAQLLAPLCDPRNMAALAAVAAVLLTAEAALCLLIIRRIPYTEIDWEAYMQEVGGYLQGELDYAKLKGDTGPLVYPAGFVYLFAWLRRLTGGSVAAAQYIFAALYLATQAVVMALYARTAALPPWSLALLCASRRLHSIFVLRLFNDCWAMFVAYVATLALQSRRWVLAVVLYSLAVSVKMNVLLMAPGVLAVLLKYARPSDVAAGTVLGVALQAALGAPFLRAYPHSYLTRAFEFSRVFTFKWSVNWAFLPQPLFVSRQLAAGLMFLHLRLLWGLAEKRWLRAEGGVLPALRRFLSGSAIATAVRAKGTSGGAAVSAGKGSRSSFEDEVLFIVFSSNLVGIVCARSIHYQFYSWYWHTLPFLLLRGRVPLLLSLAALAGIELVYNMYPPRPWAAALLHAMHAVVLFATATYRGGPSGEVTAVKLKHAAAAGDAGADDGQQAAEAQAAHGPAAAAGQRRRRQSAAA